MYCHRCTVKMEGHQRLVFRRIDGVSEDAPGQHWHPSQDEKEVGIRLNTTASAESVLAVRHRGNTT